jgi:hypothetical protein
MGFLSGSGQFWVLSTVDSINKHRPNVALAKTFIADFMTTCYDDSSREPILSQFKVANLTFSDRFKESSKFKAFYQ